MLDQSEPKILFLEDFGIPKGSRDHLPGGWVFGIGRMPPSEFLMQVFRLDSVEALPRGYGDSVRQRHSQWEGLGGATSSLQVSLEEKTNGGIVLALSIPDGESFPSFLNRFPAMPEEAAWKFCLDLVAWLKVLSASPRLLSNVHPDDFEVSARDGVFPEILFCPVPSMIREEVTLSDFQMARLWTERLSRLHAFFKEGGKAPPFEETSAGSHAFRYLLKELETGRERSLGDRFEQIADLFRKEIEMLARRGRRNDLAGGGSLYPEGPLASHFRSRAFLADPEHFGDAQVVAAGMEFRSRFELLSRDGKRSGKLLPPEQWFERSLIAPVNQRLSHPFMKAHPQCPRVRAVYCDEYLTLLTGDPGASIPLPALVTMKDGLTSAEWLPLAGKLHRALSQFESAGFTAAIETPWQIELQLEPGRSRPRSEQLAEWSLEDWPAWEVMVRVERSTESLLPGITNLSWLHVFGRLGEKFFPALLVWGLDWKRFQWSARTGNLGREPLSWDEKLLALFEAAREHLDAHSSRQREKFLALLEEGLNVK